MLNNQTNGKPGSRNEYQRAYYLRNKEKIIQRKRDREKPQEFRLGEDASRPGLNFSHLLLSAAKWLEVLALGGFISLMTYFLVREGAGFYLEGNDSLPWAYLKAGMVEGVAVLLSVIKSKGARMRWFQQGLVALFCGLTLCTMSGKLVRAALVDVARAKTTVRALSDLEAEKAQKEEFRQQLVGRGWFGAARSSEKGLDEIRHKLETARGVSLTMQTPEIVVGSLGISLALRTLVVIANLVCVRLLAERLMGALAQSKFAPPNTLGDVRVLN